jgi:hypothetical protein
VAEGCSGPLGHNGRGYFTKMIVPPPSTAESASWGYDDIAVVYEESESESEDGYHEM